MPEPEVVPGYIRGPVERFGRRIKLEYIGMISVYTIIALLIFRGLEDWAHILIAAAGAQFLFLGLKKKTRDHISGSLVLFGATAVTRPAVVGSDWVVAFFIFSLVVWAMEAFATKRHRLVYGLPLLFFAWGASGPGWIPGLAFVGTYLTEPRTDKPRLNRVLRVSFLLAAVVAPVGSLWRFGGPLPWPPQLYPLTDTLLTVWAVLAVVVAVVVWTYWNRLLKPHRYAPILFAVLAPWDVRLLAMFGMVLAVLLTATVFRLSIDSVRARPFVKHAEWHYFWYVFALAIWAVATT